MMEPQNNLAEKLDKLIQLETQALGVHGYSDKDLYSTPMGSRVQHRPAATTKPDKGAPPVKNDLKYPFPKFDADDVKMFLIEAMTWLVRVVEGQAQDRNQQGWLFHDWDFFTLRLDAYNKLQGLKMESNTPGAATHHVECFRDLESQANIDDNELIVFLFRNSLTHNHQEKFERNPPEDPWSWYREVKAIDRSHIATHPGTPTWTFGFVPTGNNCGVGMEVEPDILIQQEVLDPYKHLKGVFCEVEANKLPPHTNHDLHIELVPGGKPPQVPLYLKGPKEMVELRKYLEENLEKGFIRPSKSPACSPVTVKNCTLLLLIEEQLFLLRQATIYTKLDHKAVCNLVCIAPGDKWKTAFGTQLGLYEYLVMPFRLANASAQFQSLVNHIYCDIIGIYVVVYLDNFLIFSNSEEEHVAHVQDMLQHLQENWLFAKFSKCTFHTDTVEFLGYIIKPTGIEMDPKKVRVIKEWHIPTPCHKPYGLLQPLSTPEQPWGSISMDFIKGLPPSNGYDSILVMVDHLMKLAILAPTYKMATSQDTAELFRAHMMKQFGALDHIVLDRGWQFISATWRKFMEALLIKHLLSTAYHPQTDGQTERVSQVVEQYL
uniref:Putative retrotransposon nucleocapsid protein n=1 Tax=Ustilago esculenta TaxID=185366 RepID=A0A481SFI1_9BASI|nr:putative retrotransposon nucleocapsid protein [Ustilago esculenta]